MIYVYFEVDKITELPHYSKELGRCLEAKNLSQMPKVGDVFEVTTYEPNFHFYQFKATEVYTKTVLLRSSAEEYAFVKLALKTFT